MGGEAVNALGGWEQVDIRLCPAVPPGPRQTLRLPSADRDKADKLHASMQGKSHFVVLNLGKLGVAAHNSDGIVTAPTA